MHPSMNETELVRLDWTASGIGTPALLSHGLGDDRSTWDELVPLLATRHRVVTWDLRGHGASEVPTEPTAYTPQSGVDDLCSVIECSEAPVHLVGHSLGGLLSLTVALRRPELVRSLTLVASGPGFRDPAGQAAWNSYVSNVVRSMPVPDQAGGLARQESSWVIDHLGEVAVPMLVVVGERDRRFLAAADLFERRVPGCACIRIAGAGHHVQRTHADQVAAAVLAHLVQADAEGAAR